MKIVFTDGGCSGNGQHDPKRRRMVAVVTDESGSILVERTQEGGSNNIAELWAVKEALAWAVARNHDQIEIRTDSKNNLAWVLRTKVGKKVNDRDAVLALKSSIDSLKSKVKWKLVLIPRSRNKAGHHIENKYRLQPPFAQDALPSSGVLSQIARLRQQSMPLFARASGSPAFIEVDFWL